MLFSVYSHPFLFCPIVLLSSTMCYFTSVVLCALFPNESATVFSLQVLCSARNHDLPTSVSWGISVSNWSMWHLFSKLWQCFWGEDNTSRKSSWNVPPSPWVPGVLWSTRSDFRNWRLLLVLAVAILHIYRKRMLLMSRWR